MKPSRKFPLTRLRRNRQSANLRALVAENALSSDDLIQPIFIKEGLKGKESIESLPGVSRLGLDVLNEEIRELESAGIKAIALFPVIDSSKKDDKGSESLNEDNLVSQAIKQIKEISEMVIISDVALDPYTSHGHDGLINADGYVDNDLTLPVLTEQALVLAKAGADIIAPSDMMDGRVKSIRDAFEAKGYVNTLILSYAAKYSSKFYGPFREAVGSSANLGVGSKDTYQMDVSNVKEALQEVAMDIEEGADIVMVKPGMPYLDIVKAVKDEFSIPTFAYQVSGEYAMLKGAIDKGWLSEEAFMESLLCFKRAGADCILTYAAKEIALELNK
ncbi:MAG: porphobilinogen synthase [SAR86 cluster bacterium]|jgi:porphobilinogen synthase|nr:porphobilinogen synthase [SAR86 cluster bacterium]|tara:strand:- start:2676 stop:3671 length:996 start_codon:yes stop_codon:yes gene_type:complete